MKTNRKENWTASNSSSWLFTKRQIRVNTESRRTELPESVSTQECTAGRQCSSYDNFGTKNFGSQVHTRWGTVNSFAPCRYQLPAGRSRFDFRLGQKFLLWRNTETGSGKQPTHSAICRYLAPAPTGGKSSRELKLKNSLFLELRIRIRGSVRLLLHTQALYLIKCMTSLQDLTNGENYGVWRLQYIIRYMTAKLISKRSMLCGPVTRSFWFRFNIILPSIAITRVHCTGFKQYLNSWG